MKRAFDLPGGCAAWSLPLEAAPHGLHSARRALVAVVWWVLQACAMCAQACAISGMGLGCARLVSYKWWRRRRA